MIVNRERRISRDGDVRRVARKKSERAVVVRSDHRRDLAAGHRGAVGVEEGEVAVISYRSQRRLDFGLDERGRAAVDGDHIAVGGIIVGAVDCGAVDRAVLERGVVNRDEVAALDN